MSIKFFGNQRALFRFDPDSCETAFYETGRWVASNDPFLLNEIRFHTVELSRSDALGLICGTEPIALSYLPLFLPACPSGDGGGFPRGYFLSQR